jgi:hypothetical protein
MPGKGGKPAADAVPKKRRVSHADSEKKTSGVSFEVYHSEAGTFQSIGEYKKAINSYSRVCWHQLVFANDPEAAKTLRLLSIFKLRRT